MIPQTFSKCYLAVIPTLLEMKESKAVSLSISIKTYIIPKKDKDNNILKS